MPGYRFKAMNAKGRLVISRMEASNVDDLEHRLSKIQLDLVNCKEIQGASGPGRRGRIGRQELITFCFHLEQVMGSGVPLIEGLGDLRDTSDNPAMQAMLASLIEDVATGSQLSEGMRRFGGVFDEVFVALIAAGERTGNLQVIFASLSETLKWQDELAARTRKMLMYPLFVLIVVTGVFAFMMTFLVPRLVSFIKMMGMDLPLHTRLLIDTSDVIVNRWPFIIGTPIAMGMLLYSLIKVSPSVAYAFDWVKLEIWMFGPMTRKIIMARFASVFAMMYAAGITVLDCLTVSEQVVGNRVVGRVLA
ncbi:MAG: type II secretion system F family protein, partial [Magnetococcales bacterium]|nr:type II secretion system F family protein [Magnetococcales bacterium]